jgi:hypothetical protein
MRNKNMTQLMQKTAGVCLVCGGFILLLAGPASAQVGSSNESSQSSDQIYQDAATSINENLSQFTSTSSCSTGCNGCNRCCNTGLGFDNFDLGLGGLEPSCCLGEPFSLADEILGTCDRTINFGGWTQFGWHSESNGLFNSHDSRIQNHQSWLYAEKVAEQGCCLDWGFHIDFMYGLDAQNTQAFGGSGDDWDADWDNGIYGYAVPQLYVELAKDNWRIKAGKFYTMTGYEVVQATGNFFYSHAYTMVNSEPFTHSGFVATYSVSDDLDVYAGWTAGWDTGITQFNNGSQFLGGFAYDIGCDTTFTYIVNSGSFGQREEGYMHSMVMDHKISDCLNYVLQSDLLDTNGGDDHSFGVNQYLIYTVSDCLGYGARVEWYKFNGSSQYATTIGVNYKPCANVILRPELRHDWNPSGNRFNGDGKGNFTTVAMDAIFTF